MKQILTIILFFSLTSFTYGQTILGGVFLSDTTLTLSKSPYHVTSNVLVPNGISVKVEPGVIFYFDNSISWKVEGEFQAIGNSNDSIKFLLQPGNSGYWDGITFTQSAVSYDKESGTGCILSYCVISKSGTNYFSIWINDITVYILHSEIKNCYGGIVAYGSGDVIKHTHIHDCTFQVFTTSYEFFFPDPVIMDSCEINNIDANSDVLRLTHNAIFSNNCVHNINSTLGALAIFEGPSIEVTGNNFYDNNVTAIIMVDGPDSTVKILNNNFTNNQINISKSSCYSFPIITGNNFYSYINYNIYCTDQFLLAGPFCRPIPNGSFYSLDMTQNYFAFTSVAQLDSSIYDWYDNWIGRTIITYDTTIISPYPNNLDCDSVLYTAISKKTQSISEQILILYPNPFKDELNILTNESKNLEFTLYDMLSRKLLQQEFKNSVKLNIGNIDKGIYIYEVRNKGKVIKSGKVVRD